LKELEGWYGMVCQDTEGRGLDVFEGSIPASSWIGIME